MRHSLSLPVLVVLAGLASAQPPDRTALYSTPNVPSPAVLERLNLKLLWTTVIVTEGRRDGLLSVQFAPVREAGKTKQHMIVQTRSGIVTELDAETGQVLWRVRLGNRYSATHGAGFNSTDVIAVRGSDIFGINRKTGDLRWKAILPVIPSGTPLVDSHRIYMNVGSDRVEFYDLPSIGENAPTLFRTYRSTIPLQLEPAQSADYLYYPSPRGSVSVLVKSTSGLFVRFTTGGPLAAGPGMHEVDGGVYIGSLDTNVYGYSLLETDPSWRFSTGKPVERTPFVNDEGVYASADTKGLYRLLRKTISGAKLVGTLERRGLATPAQLQEVVKELDRKAGDPSAILSALLQKGYITESQKGKLRWRGGDDVWLNPDGDRVLAVNPKFVYAVDRPGSLVVLDRERGRTLSRFDTRDYPVPITNELTDRIYLGAHNGRIVCLCDREYTTPFKMKAILEPRADAGQPGPKKPAPPPAMFPRRGEN
jgi:hypothetical protein